MKRIRLAEVDVKEVTSFEFTTTETMEEVRTILNICLPIPYSDPYFQSIRNNEITSLEARMDNLLVGQVSWGIDKVTGKIYVYSLVVLSKYRGEGIGTKLMKRLLCECSNSTIFLHVHSVNKFALSFYEKLGFKVKSAVPNFYRRLSPSVALLLEREELSNEAEEAA